MSTKSVLIKKGILSTPTPTCSTRPGSPQTHRAKKEVTFSLIPSLPLKSDFSSIPKSEHPSPRNIIQRPGTQCFTSRSKSVEKSVHIRRVTNFASRRLSVKIPETQKIEKNQELEEEEEMVKNLEKWEQKGRESLLSIFLENIRK